MEFTMAAQQNINETGIDPQDDVDAIRSGRHTRDTLLEYCLDGADPDRMAGWRDYVDTVCAEAASDLGASAPPRGSQRPSGQICGDCCAAPGALHEPGCDVERCALCGDQAIACGCYEDSPTAHDAAVAKFGGRLPWTGEWPGAAECREWGWYARYVDGRGWVECAATDEGAGPDLNRLARCAVWDAKQRRYVLPGGAR